MSPAYGRGVDCFDSCLLFLSYGVFPAGEEGGQEEIREKMGKKHTQKNKKICIPVGEADADVRWC
jgi:hypothetical protein